MPIAPEQYGVTTAYDLLVAAARGHVPFDHRLLHRLLDNPAETLPDIVRFAKEDRSDDRVDLSVDLMRIFAVAPTPEAIPFLMAEFRRYPEEVPDEMTEVLARIGVGALEGLLELWEDGVAMEEVAFHLATLGVRDQRIVDVIEEVRKDDKEEASYLQQIYDEYAGQRPEPYDIYGDYPETDIPDLDLLPGVEREQFLDSECAEHRRVALDHLIGQDLSPAMVNRVLRMAQSDADTEVRGLAWEALRDSTDQDKIRDSMMARIDNPNTPALERASLCIGLAYNLDDETVRPHLDAAYNDPATRAKAVEAMARSFDRGFGPTMVKHLEDPDPDISQAALWGVGYLRVSSEAPKLEKMFEDPDRRTEALYCYALAAPAEDSKLGLKQLEHRMEKLANGLAEEEAELIHHAFDLRFELVGKKTSFSGGHSHGEPAAAQAVKVGRNDACPCGSGKKYKKCCGA